MIKFMKRLIGTLVYGYRYSSETFVDHLKKIGVSVGNNVVIFGPRTVVIDVLNPHLLSIGNNVNIVGGTTILTHDYSWSVLKGKFGSIYGNQKPVCIGNNVFIGHGATILAGVSIGDNVIIGADSVVSKDCENNFVYAGNPARKIISIDDFMEKRKSSQLSEAVEIAKRYHTRFGIIPPVDIFHEYFFLFTRIENSDLLNRFDSKLELMDNFEESLDFLRQNPSKFKDFDEFIKFCRLDESE